MQVILIPHVGDATFGDPIPDEKVGQPLVRVAPGQDMSVSYQPISQMIQVEQYEYKGTVVKRGGQPIIAFYEQV